MGAKTSLAVGIMVLCIHQPLLGAETLCKTDEQVYFSCVTQSKRIISLCGNVTKDDPKSWLQYRYGRQDNIELTYPQERINSLRLFIGAKESSSVISFQSVSFANNGIGYSIVFKESDIPDENFVGVRVGDPKEFFNYTGERKTNYPRITIGCTELPEIDKFFDLIRVLSGE